MDTVVWGSPSRLLSPNPATASERTAFPEKALKSTADSSRHPGEDSGRAHRTAAELSRSRVLQAARGETQDAVRYTIQPGDTLPAVALRFGVDQDNLAASNGLEGGNLGLLVPGETLTVSSLGRPTASQAWLLPDSELVYSPSAADFDLVGLAASYDGYLNEYRERVEGEWMYGPEVVARAALDHSINPRLLLAVLELRGGWLTSPERPKYSALSYPIWSGDSRLQGLYLQMSWVANELSKAYYGWRQGTYLQLDGAEGMRSRLSPELNAATVSVLHLSTRFAARTHRDPTVVAGELMQVYARLFGDPWGFDLPLFTADVSQPDLALPFPPENPWVFTGGPHGAWGTQSVWAALDFAPKWDRVRRSSKKEVVALADAIVARVERGVVILDLDGDGYEQTGWSILYLHVHPAEGIAVGTHLASGDLIGVAAEEGGVSHGLHLHIARKYNGEWVAADGPLPLDLAGWRVRAGAESYLGVLYWGSNELLACPYASQSLLSVGGGEMPSDAGLPTNLRGCWTAPGSMSGNLLTTDSPDPDPAGMLSDARPQVFDLGPTDLPPTRLLPARY